MAGVIDGTLYAVGGNIAFVGNTPTVEIYGPASNTWTTGASEPTARHLGAAGVIDSKLYATGGYDTLNINGSLEVYTAVCP
jgi:N-acetylneuraminic acid mutarotase